MVTTMDPRATKLAEIFVDYSLEVKKGDCVLIEASDMTANDLIHECYRLCLERGARVYLDVVGLGTLVDSSKSSSYLETFLTTAPRSHLKELSPITEYIYRWADKMIRIGCTHDKTLLSDVKTDLVREWRKSHEPLKEAIISMKKRVLTRFPTSEMAKDAGMSLRKFTDFYYDACIADYRRMSKRIEKMQDRLDAGSAVRIIGPDTNLTLGIQGRLAFGTATGKRNVPDGECFIAPLESKTEGYITFELPQVREGVEIAGIRLEFEKGKVVKHTAKKGKKHLDAALAHHSDNKRIGEFGIGMNPKITRYMRDTLFDEKIEGTIHIALGSAYPADERGGGKNGGSIHWDLIKEMRTKGSRVEVDGKVILRDGILTI